MTYREAIEKLESIIKEDSNTRISLYTNTHMTCVKVYIMVDNKSLYFANREYNKKQLEEFLTVCNRGNIEFLQIRGELVLSSDRSLYIDIINLYINIIKNIRIQTLDLRQVKHSNFRRLSKFIKSLSDNITILKLKIYSHQSPDCSILLAAIDCLKDNKTIQEVDIEYERMISQHLVRQIEGYTQRNRVLRRSLFGLCSSLIIKNKIDFPDWFPDMLKQQVFNTDRSLL